MPELRSAANRSDSSGLVAFKSLVYALNPIKQTVESILYRINYYVANQAEVMMESVNECVSDIIRYLDIMIDNADEYYEGMFSSNIIRYSSEAGIKYASNDISYIDKAAIKCIDIIDKHNSAK